MKKTVSLIICMILILSCSLTAFAKDTQELVLSSVDGAGFQMLNVPQIRVTTAEGNGLSLEKADGYVDASITIDAPNGSHMEDSVLFKVRGNTTAMVGIDKKAFTFKFSKKKDVLGMGKGKKWVLLANAFDPTLLRNYVANTFAHELDLAYTSNQQFVELWVDGSYRGCYGLYEPVNEGTDRVDIDIESNRGMKDFLIEYEAQRVEEDVTYFTVDKLRFIASEPEDPNEEQLGYITSTMQDIVNTLKTGTREQIEAKIDVESFAKYCFMNEYLKTFDFDMSSVFFYYKDGKLYAGPAWDYDLSAGNINDTLLSSRYKQAVPPTGMFANNKNIYIYLCDKEWFNAEVRSVYKEYYPFVSSIFADGGLMDSTYEEYREIFERNYSSGVWKVSRNWINIQKRALPTYEENYNFLKNWYQERNIWLTDNMDPFDVNHYYMGDCDADKKVTVIDATAIQKVLAESSHAANKNTHK